MNFPHNISGPTMGFVMVMLTLPISFLAGIVVGGCKVGALEKQVKLVITKAQLSLFMERLQRRLQEIGFVAGDIAGHFFQSGSSMGSLKSHTHAKTKKVLKVSVSDHGADEVVVDLTAKYLDMIVGDTGEAAYRDSVLNYVSGTTETMAVIPNRSFAAFSCLISGLCAWPALIYLKSVQYEPLDPPFLVYGLTAITLGIMAIYAIKQRPVELKGIPHAVIGMILVSAAAGYALLGN